MSDNLTKGTLYFRHSRDQMRTHAQSSPPRPEYAFNTCQKFCVHTPQDNAGASDHLRLGRLTSNALSFATRPVNHERVYNRPIRYKSTLQDNESVMCAPLWLCHLSLLKELSNLLPVKILCERIYSYQTRV